MGRGEVGRRFLGNGWSFVVEYWGVGGLELSCFEADVSLAYRSPSLRIGSLGVGRQNEASWPLLYRSAWLHYWRKGFINCRV